MWAVVPGPVSEERATAFADTAPLVALQLLRWRAVADVQRRRSAEQVRLLLDGSDGWRAAANELAVPNEAHRVIAIEMPASDEPAEGQRLAMWEWITRGIGRRPLVTEIGAVLYALVPDRARGGGWPELRQALLSHDLSPRPLIAVGTSVPVTDVPRSRAQAEELIGLLRTGLAHNGPYCTRYPRDKAPAEPPPAAEVAPIPYGSWDVLRRGRDCAILAVGGGSSVCFAGGLDLGGVDRLAGGSVGHSVWPGTLIFSSRSIARIRPFSARLGFSWAE